MKTKYFILLIFISACFNKDKGGSGYYFVQNNSIEDFSVTYRLLPEHGSFEDTVEVASNTQVELYHLFEIGINPRPSDAFQSIIVLDLNQNIIYMQDPIDDSLWQADAQFKRNYGRTNYYLVID